MASHLGSAVADSSVTTDSDNVPVLRAGPRRASGAGRGSRRDVGHGEVGGRPVARESEEQLPVSIGTIPRRKLSTTAEERAQLLFSSAVGGALGSAAPGEEEEALREAEALAGRDGSLRKHGGGRRAEGGPRGSQAGGGDGMTLVAVRGEAEGDAVENDDAADEELAEALIKEELRRQQVVSNEELVALMEEELEKVAQRERESSRLEGKMSCCERWCWRAVTRPCCRTLCRWRADVAGGRCCGAKAAQKGKTMEEKVVVRLSVMEAFPSDAKCVLNPRDKWMMRWDVLMVAMLMFVVLVTPYEVAYLAADPSVDALFWMNRLVDVTFLVDMVCNFFLGYQVDGARWVVEHDRIAAHYMSSWFAVDLVSMLPFDALPLIAGGDGALTRLSVVRVVRLLRLFKMVRVVRAMRIFTRWQERLAIPYAWTQMLSYVALILLMAHWIACAWRLAVDIEGGPINAEGDHAEAFVRRLAQADEENTSWIVRYSAQGSYTPGSLYITALYFSLVTIATVGYGDVQPATETERVVAIILILVGVSVWTLMVGSVTTLLSSFAPSSAHFFQTMDALTTFAAEHSLPEDLTLRLRRYLHYSRDIQVATFDKALYAAMSPSLRREVAVCINRGWVERVPFFRFGVTGRALGSLRRGVPESQRDDFIMEVALTMRPLALAPGEAVVHVGEFAHQLYVVQRGLLSRTGRVLFRGSVFGEDVVLPAAKRTYSVHALTYATLLSVERGDLEHILLSGRFPAIALVLRKFAVRASLLREFLHYARLLAIMRQLDREFRITSPRSLRLLDMTIGIRYPGIRHLMRAEAPATGVEALGKSTRSLFGKGPPPRKSIFARGGRMLPAGLGSPKTTPGSAPAANVPRTNTASSTASGSETDGVSVRTGEEDDATVAKIGHTVAQVLKKQRRESMEGFLAAEAAGVYGTTFTAADIVNALVSSSDDDDDGDDFPSDVDHTDQSEARPDSPSTPPPSARPPAPALAAAAGDPQLASTPEGQRALERATLRADADSAARRAAHGSSETPPGSPLPPPQLPPPPPPPQRNSKRFPPPPPRFSSSAKIAPAPEAALQQAAVTNPAHGESGATAHGGAAATTGGAPHSAQAPNPARAGSSGAAARVPPTSARGALSPAPSSPSTSSALSPMSSMRSERAAGGAGGGGGRMQRQASALQRVMSRGAMLLRATERNAHLRGIPERGLRMLAEGQDLATVKRVLAEERLHANRVAWMQSLLSAANAGAGAGHMSVPLRRGVRVRLARIVAPAADALCVPVRGLVEKVAGRPVGVRVARSRRRKSPGGTVTVTTGAAAAPGDGDGDDLDDGAASVVSRDSRDERPVAARAAPGKESAVFASSQRGPSALSEYEALRQMDVPSAPSNPSMPPPPPLAGSRVDPPPPRKSSAHHLPTIRDESDHAVPPPIHTPPHGSPRSSALLRAPIDVAFHSGGNEPSPLPWVPRRSSLAVRRSVTSSSMRRSLLPSADPLLAPAAAAAVPRAAAGGADAAAPFLLPIPLPQPGSSAVAALPAGLAYDRIVITYLRPGDPLPPATPHEAGTRSTTT
jgi:CRP-like cAMP-binding protein